jgi:hypothetical protein
MSLHEICGGHMVKALVCDQGNEGPIVTLNTMKDSHVDKSWLTWLNIINLMWQEKIHISCAHLMTWQHSSPTKNCCVPVHNDEYFFINQIIWF